jgi:hypothetical protein
MALSVSIIHFFSIILYLQLKFGLYKSRKCGILYSLSLSLMPNMVVLSSVSGLTDSPHINHIKTRNVTRGTVVILLQLNTTLAFPKMYFCN